jgi:hypothetical protein
MNGNSLIGNDAEMDRDMDAYLGYEYPCNHDNKGAFGLCSKCGGDGSNE